MAHFSDIGTNCSLERCRERDFLPFKCEHCSRRYCLIHRTPESHECPVWNKRQREPTTIRCSTCANVVRVDSSKESHRALEEHVREGCSTAKVPERCQATGCQTHLKPSNSVRCNKCHKKVCLRHRYEDTHQCHIPASSRDNEWTCVGCGVHNRSARTVCTRCGKARRAEPAQAWVSGSSCVLS